MLKCEKTRTEEARVPSPWQRAGTLGLLTLCYTLGELGHFLIATTSKQVANSLQFGDLRCYADHKTNNVTNAVCMNVKTQVTGQLFTACQSSNQCCSLSARLWRGVSGATPARAGSTRSWRGPASSSCSPSLASSWATSQTGTAPVLQLK